MGGGVCQGVGVREVVNMVPGRDMRQESRVSFSVRLERWESSLRMRGLRCRQSGSARLGRRGPSPRRKRRGQRGGGAGTADLG